MNKTFLLLASSAILMGVASHKAEARKISYEIDGKRYSYSTNNIAQTAEAKARIEAARAAEAARAKAAAEKGENPSPLFSALRRKGKRSRRRTSSNMFW